MYLWKEGGYGARPGKKDNHTAISLYASGTRNEPVEVQERVYPILTHCYEFITDSAGRRAAPRRHRRRPRLRAHARRRRPLGARQPRREPVWGWDGGLPRWAAASSTTPAAPTSSRSASCAPGVHARKGPARSASGRAAAAAGGNRERGRRVGARGRDRRLVSIEAARELYGVAISVVDQDAACTRSTPGRRSVYDRVPASDRPGRSMTERGV